MKAIYMGDLNTDLATNGQEIVTLSRFLDDNNGYRFKESLGTQPRVWFLPGHGQAFGRDASNSAQLKAVAWPFGEKDYSSQPGVWPWSQPAKWPWEVQVK